MKNKTLALIAIGLIAATSLTSCLVKADYTTAPAYNNNTYYNVYDEEFNTDDPGWSFTDSRDSAYGDVAQGTYELVNYSRTRGQLVAVNTGANMQYDFSVQTKMQSNNTMAMVFGASSADNGYALYIDNQGYFALYNEGSAYYAPNTVIDWTFNNTIIKGGWNNVQIVQYGNYWIGYINGTQVFKIPSQVLYGSQCGFKVLPGTTGYADYLEVKW